MFETGHIYLPRPNDLPEEPEMLCGVLTSTGIAKVWQGRKEPVDFFDAKGAVEGLMAALGVEAEYKESDDAGLRSRQGRHLSGLEMSRSACWANCTRRCRRRSSCPLAHTSSR